LIRRKFLDNFQTAQNLEEATALIFFFRPRRHWAVTKRIKQNNELNLTNKPTSGVFKGGHGAMPPLWPDHENFLQATLYEKVRFLPFPSKNCKIHQCLMVFLNSYRYNMRLKSSCEIVSDMTPASPNAFENQLQAVGL